ncbi:MAG: glycerate kinase type-2 family protein [Promethearchaeota archaeon]
MKNNSQLLVDVQTENALYLRKIALEALERALEAIKPSNLIQKTLSFRKFKLRVLEQEFSLNKNGTIYIIGGGKAAAEMAFALEELLLKNAWDRYEGIINIPEGLEIDSFHDKSKIKLNRASHPIPNMNGVQGVKEMMSLIEKSREEDVIICLITGGGSALLPLPREGISLKDLQVVNAKLLACGASIQEINTIRKHLSAFKGGNLAKKVHKTSRAKLITLIISDVIGDPLDVIASGPTVPDRSFFEDALKILKKYNILEAIPFSTRQLIEEGAKGKREETPKENDACFQKVYNFLIGSVKVAINNIVPFLEQEEFQADYFSDEISGEARKFGKILFNKFKTEYHVFNEKKAYLKKQALIGSGELTVTIKGKGIGGRNQEMLLSFIKEAISHAINRDFLILSANLDGIEGNSEAMGALVDNLILEQTNQLGLNPDKYLEDNDSNSFFKKVQSELISGPTGCNVNDLLICLII